MWVKVSAGNEMQEAFVSLCMRGSVACIVWGWGETFLFYWQTQLCSACGRPQTHTRAQMAATCALRTLLCHPLESLLVTYGLWWPEPSTARYTDRMSLKASITALHILCMKVCASICVRAVLNVRKICQHYDWSFKLFGTALICI